MVNFGLLAAEIVSLVWGTPGNFNGFRVLAALLHCTLVVGVSQTAAFNRGRHLYSAGRPSRLALAHILVSVFFWHSGRSVAVAAAVIWQVCEWRRSFICCASHGVCDERTWSEGVSHRSDDCSLSVCPLSTVCRVLRLPQHQRQVVCPQLPLLLPHAFNGLFSRTIWVSRHQKGKSFWILLEQELMGWQWHQLDHM